MREYSCRHLSGLAWCILVAVVVGGAAAAAAVATDTAVARGAGGEVCKAVDFRAAPSAPDGPVGRGCQYPTPVASLAGDRQSLRVAAERESQQH